MITQTLVTGNVSVRLTSLWMEDTHLDPSIKHGFQPPVHALSIGCIRCVTVMTLLCSS